MYLSLKELLNKKVKLLFLIVALSATIIMLLISVSSFKALQMDFYNSNKVINTHVNVQASTEEKRTYLDYIKANDDLGVQYLIGDFLIDISNDMGAYLRGINEDENTFNKTNKLESGRYFTKDEIENGDKKIILTKNYEKLIYEKNGKQFIDLLDLGKTGDEITYVPYEVVGIHNSKMGVNTNLRVIVPAKALPTDILNANTSINIGYLKSEFNENFQDSLEEKLETNFTNFSYDSKNAKNSYLQAIDGDQNTYRDFLFDVLICLISVIITLVIFLEDLKKNYAIKRLVGGSKRDILKDVFIKVSFISVISIIFAIMIFQLIKSFLATLFNQKIDLFLEVNITFGIVYIFIVIILVFVSLRNILKFRIKV